MSTGVLISISSSLSGGGFEGSCGAGEEAEQCAVDCVGVGPADVVRATLDRDDRYVRDELAEPCGGGLEGEDAVLGTVEDQRRDVDLGQVVAEVGEPRVHAGVGGMGR